MPAAVNNSSGICPLRLFHCLNATSPSSSKDSNPELIFWIVLSIFLICLLLKRELNAFFSFSKFSIRLCIPDFIFAASILFRLRASACLINLSTVSTPPTPSIEVQAPYPILCRGFPEVFVGLSGEIPLVCSSKPAPEEVFQDCWSAECEVECKVQEGLEFWSILSVPSAIGASQRISALSLESSSWVFLFSISILFAFINSKISFAVEGATKSIIYLHQPNSFASSKCFGSSVFPTIISFTLFSIGKSAIDLNHQSSFLKSSR